MSIDPVSEAIDKINMLLDPESVLFFLNYRTNTLEQRGTVFKCFCPIHQDTIIRSLSIDPMKKTFRCKFMQCPGSRGGTLFELYQMATKKEKLEAIFDLAERLQIELDKDALEKYEAQQEEEEHASMTMESLDIEGISESVPEQSEETQTDSGKSEDIDSFAESLKTTQFKKTDVPDDIVSMFAESVEETESAETNQPQETHEESIPEEQFVEQPEGEAEEQTQQVESVNEVMDEEIQTESVDSEPSDYQGLMDEAWDLFARNSYTKAYELTDKARGLSSTSREKLDSTIFLGKICINLSRFDEAIKLLQESTSYEDISDPVLKDVYLQLGLAYRKKKMPQEARKYYDRIIEKWGSDLEAESQLQKLKSESAPSSSSIDDSRISYV